jgi:hypothetical protein
MVNSHALIEDAKGLETVPAMRWPDGVRCPGCGPDRMTEDGPDDARPDRQRSDCHVCRQRSDDLTDTTCAAHHQPLRVPFLCRYVMGLNRSNEQVAQERDLDPDDAQVMAPLLRDGSVRRQPGMTLRGAVECDEVSVVAGHTGHPEAVRKQGDPADVAGCKGHRPGGRWRRRSRRSLGRSSGATRPSSGCWRMSSR